MSKEIKVEVRVGYDEIMSGDELRMLDFFRDTSQNAIKRRVVEAVVDKVMAELEPMEIDLSDLKQLVKDRIIDRKVDEVLEHE